MRGTGSLHLAISITTLALSWTGCAQEPLGLAPTTESVVTNVFQPACATSGCHTLVEPAAGLDLSSADGVARSAIGRAPTLGTAAMRYPAIIVPGDPDASFLIAKVTQPGADEGIPMPPTEYMLTEEAVSTLREWIASMPARP